MCDKQQLVPIPDHLRPEVDFDAAHPEFGIDAEGRECISLDACLVPAIKALWAAGVVTVGCCCGHGSGKGVVSLKTKVRIWRMRCHSCPHAWEANRGEWTCPVCGSLCTELLEAVTGDAHPTHEQSGEN